MLPLELIRCCYLIVKWGNSNTQGFNEESLYEMIKLNKGLTNYRSESNENGLLGNELELPDIRISWALMIVFVILTLQYFVLAYFNLFGTPYQSTVQAISKLIVGLVYIWALPYVLKRIRMFFLISLWIASIIFLFHFLIFPDNSEYILDIGLSFFITCWPAFVYALSIRELHILKRIMAKASFYIFIIGTLLGFFILGGRVSIGVYSMPLSYYLLLPAIMYSDMFLERFRIKHGLMAVIATILIILIGARGPLLCLGVYIMLRMGKYFESRRIYTVFLYILFWVSLIVLFVYFQTIMEFVYNLYVKHGYYSRTLWLLTQPTVFMSGRDRIYQEAMTHIFGDRYLFGYGIGGDRIILGGMYVHNFYLEVLLNFGVLFGGLIALFVTLLLFTLLLTTDRERYNMYITWIALGFVPLMVSSSYLININFWILLGLSLQRIGDRLRCRDKRVIGKYK